MQTFLDYLNSHKLTLSLVLGGLATQIGSLNNWHEVFTPQFIAGTFLMLSGVLRAATVPTPEGK